MMSQQTDEKIEREYTYSEYIREFRGRAEREKCTGNDDPKRAASEIVEESLQKLCCKELGVAVSR